jgi:hypothetical protein
MAASGDPSTFDFVMDAFPGYTRFDSTTKKMCVIQIVGVDKPGEAESSAHSHEEQDPSSTPAFKFTTTANKVAATAFDDMSIKENQTNITVAKTTVKDDDKVIITVAKGATLNSVVPTGTTWPAGQWVAIDYNTGEKTIEGIAYKSLTNGSTHVFDATDVAEAEALGLGAGHFVLWTRADGTLPAEFELKNDTKAVKASVDFK